MSTVEAILAAVVVLLVLLAVGGALARRRQLAATEDRFANHLAQVNHDLAAARAGDRGWDPERLEAAARAAFSAQNPGTQPEAVELWQVEDRPGTDSDRAVYRVSAGGQETMITLARRGDDWFAT